MNHDGGRITTRSNDRVASDAVILNYVRVAHFSELRTNTCLNCCFDLTTFGKNKTTLRWLKIGWGGRTRTCECQNQNLMPYQLGDTPTVQNADRKLNKTRGVIKRSSVLPVTKRGVNAEIAGV